MYRVKDIEQVLHSPAPAAVVAEHKRQRQNLQPLNAVREEVGKPLGLPQKIAISQGVKELHQAVASEAQSKALWAILAEGKHQTHGNRPQAALTAIIVRQKTPENQQKIPAADA